MSFKENESKGKKFHVSCIECKNKTNHLVIQDIQINGSEIVEIYMDGSNQLNQPSISWCDDYQIIQCQGCETVSFRHLNWFSEHYNPEFGELGETERLYPQRSSSSMPTAEFHNIPIVLRRIYRETIDAFNYESFTLCAGGLRALVEGICGDQKIIDGPSKKLDDSGQPKRINNLEGKIAGLHERKLLTIDQANHLNEHRYLGNEALHELQQPSTAELRLAIEIIEHTLKSLYEIPEKTKLLKSSKAKRTGNHRAP